MSSDAEFAAEIAEAAGSLLLTLRSAEVGSTEPQELGERGDKLANDYLLRCLAADRPADAVLSEESADNPIRLRSDRVWIVDPLDGSREYGLEGRSDWAVHVALWERGREITAAAVAMPTLNAVYSTDGAYSTDPAKRVHPTNPAHTTNPTNTTNPTHPTHQTNPTGPTDTRSASTAPPHDGRLRFLVSDSRPPAFATPVAAEVGADLIPMGSAGAKAMAVLRGEADAYLHAGGQWEWDSAAPVGVVLASGLHASRIDGAPLVYNSEHPYVPDLLICRAELADTLLDAISRHVDSARVQVARAYIDALVSHRVGGVSLAADCLRVENGKPTGSIGPEILEDLRAGPQYQPIQRVRNLTFREWETNVVARYVLDLRPDTSAHDLSVHVTEHFAIPTGEITSIVTIVEPPAG